MSIAKESELQGMIEVSQVVAATLKAMRSYAEPGMSTHHLDTFGAQILSQAGAQSAPQLAYGFPGWTCISVNHAFCHGIPSKSLILREGDLVNIDVSAELNGFWSDNGSSFVLGQDRHGFQPLVDASKEILKQAIHAVRGGTSISKVGALMERKAKKQGFKVIKNLAGHGIGRSLHEQPANIFNYRDPLNFKRFKVNSVIALETFISTHSDLAHPSDDGWTMVGNHGGFMAQHEHTLVVTEGDPIILTASNSIWN